MSLRWSRMENAWHRNPKFLMLIDDGKWRAIAVYWAGLGWSREQGQGGFIPYFALTQIHGTKRQATELIEVGLWDPAEGGWAVHDYADFQPTVEEEKERRKRAQDAAFVRWHGDALSNARRNA